MMPRRFNLSTALRSVRDVAITRSGFNSTIFSIFTWVTFPTFSFARASGGRSQYVVTPTSLSWTPSRYSFSVMVGPRETILRGDKPAAFGQEGSSTRIAFPVTHARNSGDLSRSTPFQAIRYIHLSCRRVPQGVPGHANKKSPSPSKGIPQGEEKLASRRRIQGNIVEIGAVDPVSRYISCP